MARDIASTDAFVTSHRERKKVQILFAHLRRILRLNLRRRGPTVLGTSSTLQEPLQKLRKLAKLTPMPPAKAA